MQKILLVEDNETITKGLKYSLEQEKFEVETAQNIVMAKTKIKKGKFDLYLLDISLPDGDGYYCVKDASEGYYGKEPKEMNRNEASMLAGIPNAPSAYCPTKHLSLAKQRQIQVLDKMVKYKFITEQDKTDILQEDNAVEK